jgi:RND superfamily putative drug exporter
MKLLGNANWYLPRWLGWLPDVSHGTIPVGPELPEPRQPQGDREEHRQPTAVND